MKDFFKKLAYIFSSRDRWHIILLFILILGIAALETLSIGLIMPFVAAITTPELIEQNQYLSKIYLLLGMENRKEFLIWMCISLVAIYIIKNCYLAAAQYFKFKILVRKQVELYTYLLKTYQKSPYAFHLERNSAELLQSISADVSILIRQVVLGLLDLTTEMLIALMIVALLITIDPFSALISLALLGTVSAIFFIVVRKKVTAIGIERKFNLTKMVQWIQQTLGGIKETKITGREKFFTDSFEYYAKRHAKAVELQSFIQLTPRLFLETLVIIGIVSIIGSLIIEGRSVESFLPILSLYGAAAVRLMPSITRSIAAANQLRYYSSSVDQVYHDVKYANEHQFELESNEANDRKLTFSKEIEARNITFRYQGADRDALRNLSFTIPKGASIGFVGSSGAGKTTAVDVLLGLLVPSVGSVYCDGVDIFSNLRPWRNLIGYIPQTIYLLDDSIKRNITFGVPDEQMSEEKLHQAMRFAQIEEFVAGLPNGVDTVIGEGGVRLSGGQRQRIGIARALYHNPDILVMDEATAALDNETERHIADAVAGLSGEKTVIIIAHRLSTVKNCDLLFVFRDGQVVASGRYNELLDSSSDFKAMVNATEIV